MFQMFLAAKACKRQGWVISLGRCHSVLENEIWLYLEKISKNVLGGRDNQITRNYTVRTLVNLSLCISHHGCASIFPSEGWSTSRFSHLVVNWRKRL